MQEISIGKGEILEAEWHKRKAEAAESQAGQYRSERERLERMAKVHDLESLPSPIWFGSALVVGVGVCLADYYLNHTSLVDSIVRVLPTAKPVTREMGVWLFVCLINGFLALISLLKAASESRLSRILLSFAAFGIIAIDFAVGAATAVAVGIGDGWNPSGIVVFAKTMALNVLAAVGHGLLMCTTPKAFSSMPRSIYRYKIWKLDRQIVKQELLAAAHREAEVALRQQAEKKTAIESELALPDVKVVVYSPTQMQIPQPQTTLRQIADQRSSHGGSDWDKRAPNGHA